jgi:hypothetical protein
MKLTIPTVTMMLQLLQCINACIDDAATTTMYRCVHVLHLLERQSFSHVHVFRTLVVQA